MQLSAWHGKVLHRVNTVECYQVGYCGLDARHINEGSFTEGELDVESACAGYFRWDLCSLAVQVTGTYTAMAHATTQQACILCACPRAAGSIGAACQATRQA